MSQLGMPDIIVAFKERGIEAIQRSQRGIVMLVLEEADKDLVNDHLNLFSVDDIPSDAGISEANIEQMKLALEGYQLAPKKVMVYFIPPLADGATEQDYTEVLKLAEGVKFTYLVIPQIRASQVRDIASWIKSMRTVKHIMAKAVLPNCAADNEGVINFTNSIIKTADKSYTAAEYCSRIAGLLAGTPMTIATTYAPLSELVEVERETKEQRDARVARGEFFLFSDMQKIKVARAVNSFVTTYQGKGDQFKKCKIVELLDMIHDDIRQTGHDSYIGKYANSKENRDLLCTAITGYFKTLETEGLLEIGENEAFIDLTAVKNWRMSNGLNTQEELESMDEGELKKLNLHDNVFIAADLSPLDAMENIQVNCSID